MKAQSIHLLRLFLSITIFFVWAHGRVASAEETRPRDLPQETADPTAPLASITLQGDRPADTMSLAVANPYRLWSRPSLLHTAISRGSTHLANLLIFDRPWGRIGLGVNARLIAPPPGREDLQVGPALGFVYMRDHCRFGLLNTNYFNDDVSISAAQLIAGCSLGDGWSVSAGGFTALYNWRTEKFLELPLSVQIGRVVNVMDQPLQFFINPRYNTQDTPGIERWRLTIGVTFVADHL